MPCSLSCAAATRARCNGCEPMCPGTPRPPAPSPPSSATRRALLSHPAAIAEIPLFLAALLMVRGTPALLYARRFGKRHAEVAGLMQATSLTFVIVAAQIGTATGQISQTTAAALLAAGLLSAALFPAAALKLLTARTPGAEAHLSRSGVMTTPIRMPEVEAGRLPSERQPTAIAQQQGRLALVRDLQQRIARRRTGIFGPTP